MQAAGPARKRLGGLNSPPHVLSLAVLQDFDASVIVVEAHGTAAAANVVIQGVGADIAGNSHREVGMDFAERRLGGHRVTRVVWYAYAHRRKTGANSDRPARLAQQRYLHAAVLIIDIHRAGYAFDQHGAEAGLHIGAAADA